MITRAVSRYIQLHGEPVNGRFLRVVCPVNVRREDTGESLGNQITFMPVALPLDIDEPVRMLHAVTMRTEIMKNARTAHLVALMASWLGAAPPPLQALFWSAIPLVTLPMPLLNLICTNVPGSPTPLYAAGSEDDRFVSARAHRLRVGGQLRGAELRWPTLLRLHGRRPRGTRCGPAARSHLGVLSRVGGVSQSEAEKARQAEALRPPTATTPPTDRRVRAHHPVFGIQKCGIW